MTSWKTATGASGQHRSVRVSSATTWIVRSLSRNCRSSMKSTSGRLACSIPPTICYMSERSTVFSISTSLPIQFIRVRCSNALPSIQCTKIPKDRCGLVPTMACFLSIPQASYTHSQSKRACLRCRSTVSMRAKTTPCGWHPTRA